MASEKIRRGRLFNDFVFAGAELLDEYMRYGNVIGTERLKAMDALMQELFGMAIIIESDILLAEAERRRVDGRKRQALVDAVS